MQKQDVDRHIRRVHERVKQGGGKLRYMCNQCPAGYSLVRMLDQHVKGVHAPPKRKEDHDHIKNEDDIGSGLIDELGDTEEPSSEDEDNEQNLDQLVTELVTNNEDSPGNDDLLNIERSVGSGNLTSEIERADENREKEEEELVEKELADKEMNVKQSEERAEKETRAKMDILNELKKKHEYLCKKVGSEKAERIFQKVYTAQCKKAANKSN